MAIQDLVPRRAKRIGLAAVGILAFAALTIGVLHMPWARSLLQRVGGCPVDVDVIDDNDVLVPNPAQQGVTASRYPCDSCDSWQRA